LAVQLELDRSAKTLPVEQIRKGIGTAIESGAMFATRCAYEFFMVFQLRKTWIHSNSGKPDDDAVSGDRYRQPQPLGGEISSAMTL
jgi:hypothetical protein